MRLAKRITPCLWFNSNAEEAIDYYLTIFEDSKVLAVQRCGEAGPGPQGSVLSMTFELAGQQFVAINGGPMFTFNEAISLLVQCDSQSEVDDYWEKLVAGGEPSRCGWLKDKFGLWWQVVPTALSEMLGDPDAAKAARVMQAMLQMAKLDVARLQAAYHGE